MTSRLAESLLKHKLSNLNCRQTMVIRDDINGGRAHHVADAICDRAAGAGLKACNTTVG